MSFFICIVVGGRAAIFTETEENHHQRQWRCLLHHDVQTQGKPIVFVDMV